MAQSIPSFSSSCNRIRSRTPSALSGATTTARSTSRGRTNTVDRFGFGGIWRASVSIRCVLWINDASVQQVYRHTLGDDPRNDQLLFEEPDPAFLVDVAITKDRVSLSLSPVRSITQALLPLS